ncbi:MAG: tetratricopeptide repeat protein [Thermoguttaceae bacterium]|nr:tetratricopeptide repeat protein [Thermoguttaceae bacterium]
MSKSRIPLPTYLWPGLPQLTQRGTWTALFWALATAFLADGVIITRYIWPETFDVVWDNVILGCFLGVYIVGCTVSYFIEKSRNASSQTSNEDLFPEAQKRYLEGRYFEAEQDLVQLLNKTPEDIPARLLLIDLLVVNRRLEEAVKALKETIDFSEAQQWKWELIAVNEHIKQVRQDLAEHGVM